MHYRYLAYKYTRRGGPEAAFQEIWESFSSRPMRPTVKWRPSTDIYETPETIIVVVELAGVAEEHMTVTLFSDLLVLEGKRDQPLTDMSACHQLGIKYGPFISEVSIHSPVDHETVDIEQKNGLLTITLHKR